jgi:pyridoxine/pyridoxamine 5'-phosphate oxidase
MRRNYDGRLREEDLAPTWVEQFDRWFAEAVAAELPAPNAVVVATAAARSGRWWSAVPCLDTDWARIVSTGRGYRRVTRVRDG